ncbi:hypothetical protein AVEN_173689-1 [Araneus ventricosus]|uniref:Uncharacterized protein n=1 Tax=Araneus ventricosus TaxID=182803 RepID=A0A4Y2V3M4_ARAVE|nr:hypothetical protein AVEN_165644-1 [Araneus ventricosus]GBO19218.1 hypothetical protein AVEN_173689-1 [Araneus ventricosus]
MTKTTPQLAPPSSLNFRTTPAGATGPPTRRIFSEIGFRIWNPPAPKPIPDHYTIVTSGAKSDFFFRCSQVSLTNRTYHTFPLS